MARQRKSGKSASASEMQSLLSGLSQSDLEAFLKSAARVIEGDDDVGDEALDRAQEIAFDAMEATTSRKRISLAHKALAISPLCSDAYLILANETVDPAEALELHKRAVAAGAEALGEAAFERNTGHFWGLLETRPYMRALHELAMVLWREGARDEAVSHYKDMLRLNPNDNQGIRYLLLDAYLELGREPEAAELIKLYRDDGSAAWAWSEALLAFRRSGDAPAARKLLTRATGVNSHVTAYLIGRKSMPRRLPDFIGIGDDNEAVAYVHDSDGAWSAAAGARAWVAESLGHRAPSQGDLPLGLDKHDVDPDRVDDAVLALLLLGLHDGNRVWKGFDWSALDRLHARGMISDPAGKAKSIALTAAGHKEARRLHAALFSRGPRGR
jgi:tetratricopeptide (TPR) repeat protein